MVGKVSSQYRVRYSTVPSVPPDFVHHCLAGWLHLFAANTTYLSYYTTRFGLIIEPACESAHPSNQRSRTPSWSVYGHVHSCHKSRSDDDQGKRKTAKKPMAKKKAGAMPTTFACLFCNMDNTVHVKLDKKAGIGELVCKHCDQRYQHRITSTIISIIVHSCRTHADRLLQVSASPMTYGMSGKMPQTMLHRKLLRAAPNRDSRHHRRQQRHRYPQAQSTGRMTMTSSMMHDKISMKTTASSNATTKTPRPIMALHEHSFRIPINSLPAQKLANNTPYRKNASNHYTDTNRKRSFYLTRNPSVSYRLNAFVLLVPIDSLFNDSLSPLRIVATYETCGTGRPAEPSSMGLLPLSRSDCVIRPNSSVTCTLGV